MKKILRALKISTRTKPILSSLNIVTCCLVVLLSPGSALADGNIYPDVPEASNPLNTAFNYTLTSSTNGAAEVVGRSGTYTYRPAVVKMSNQNLDMWFCSSDAGSHGDAIWFTSSSDSGKTWSSYTEVVSSSYTRNDYLDYHNACDPSVTTDGSYFYIFYTGSTDWPVNPSDGSKYALWPNGFNNGSGSGGCLTGNNAPDINGNCDNRIFVARVPISSPSAAASYQKLVDVGECASSGCFQYQPFWGPGDPSGIRDYYAPVPVVRNEGGPVWRRQGTGSTGYTGPQTQWYGIGQPSAMNVQALRIWYTEEIPDQSPHKIAEMVEWQPYQNLSDPYNIQNQSNYTVRVSNTNDVDYSVAFDSNRNRYVAAIGRSPYQPCVNYAIKTGWDTTIPSGADPNNPDATNNEIITRNLLGDANSGSDGTNGCLSAAGTYAHNVGLLRDQYGYFVTSPDPSNNQAYWVYYADNASLASNYWHIARVPFTVSP